MGQQSNGQVSTSNILGNKLVVDMSEKISLLDPNETPFMTFLKRAMDNSEAANSFKFEWIEEDTIGGRWDAVNNAAGYVAGATSIVVDNGDYFTAGDTVKVPRTGEVFLVTAIATNTLTITRAFGTTLAAALVDNDPIVIIGNANAEGSGTRAIKSTKGAPKFNYTQIIKTPFGITNTLLASKTYGGNALAQEMKKKAIQHKVDMARAFYFGEKFDNGNGTRGTGGLLSFLSQNNYDAGGLLTQAEFDNNISEVVFKHGSKEKLLLCSSRLLAVINGWAMGKLQVVNQDAKSFGLNVVEYQTAFGKYFLMNDSRILEGATYGTYGIVIDPAYIKYKPLRDTKLETNIQANDADGRTDQYITEAGLEVRMPEAHAVITGVTS